MLLIGDVHGKIGDYLSLCSTARGSIQLGDLSNDFRVIRNALPKDGHRFIRGNHDPRKQIATMPQWIEDGTVEGDMMMIGGSDHYPGIHPALLPDRTIPTYQWIMIEAIYRDQKPRIMLTHDCPSSAGRIMDRFDYTDTYTAQWLDRLFQFHVPELWVFGHWHQSRNFWINECNFVCLDTLETYNL